MQSVRQNIFSECFSWQFVQVPKFLFEVWNNYFNFAGNLFSVPLLLRTFFAPWRRYSWNYPKNFNIVEFFNTIISNIFSRILGAIMRLVLIITGILFQIFVVIAGLIIFIGWIILPFIVIFGILFFIY